jgi:predicted Zn-dependent protease
VIAVRVAIVLVALAAVAWLGVGLSASRAQEDLAHLVATTADPDRADYERAADLRRRAERTPGRRPTLLEATLHMKGDDRAGAARLLERLVEDEPDNAEAWLLLSQASDEREAQARARVRELAPDVPAP